MRLDTMLRTMVPLVVLAAASAGCSNESMNLTGEQGVPLAELDLSGTAPDQITLTGPDTVLVSRGAAFAISVDPGSDQAEHLRFLLEDGALSIMRENGWNNGASRAATVRVRVRVTLPSPPHKLSLAGSGEMTSDGLASAAEVSIAGSGTLATPQIAVDALDISISGSGSYRAAGRVGRLHVNLTGSGDAQLAGLKAERAEVSIAGSGSTMFASDGEVDVSIVGSGDVRVRGGARCTVSAIGSGKLTCERETGA